MKCNICGFCGVYKEITSASVVGLRKIKLICKTCEESKRNDELKKFLDNYKYIIANHVR